MTLKFIKKVTPFSNLRLFIILIFEYFLGGQRQLVDAGLEIDKARKASQASVKLSSFLFNNYKKVQYVEDKNIDGVPCRIYSNSNAAGRPIILFFHSGGFVMFDYTSPDYTLRRLCKQLDAIFISVDYRKAPEHKFGAMQEDAEKVLNWVNKEAVSLGGDANKIFACGHSSGGYLSSYLAKYAAQHEDCSLRGHISIYPWLDLKMSYPSISQPLESPICTPIELEWCIDHLVDSKEDLNHPDADLTQQQDFGKLCPGLIMTCEMDILKDEANAYAAKLKEAGVPVMHREYKAMVHGFMYFPNVFNPRKKEEHPFKYIETFVNHVCENKELPNIEV